MPHRTFLPIGLPRDARTTDSVDERVGLHLLEALDALDTLYKSAAFFAEASDEAELARFTLSACLDAVRSSDGALFLADEAGLHLADHRGDATARLRIEELANTKVLSQPALWNGSDADTLVAEAAGSANVLTTPIHVGAALAGLVVAIAPRANPFSTADAKLIAAVASQAAIALGRARHLRQVEQEREKLRLVVQNHPEGIAVLDRHGDTRLLNPIARELLGGDDVLAVLGTVDGTLEPAVLQADRIEREIAIGSGTGSRVLLVKTRPLATAAHDAGDVVVTVRDLTRLRREERLKRNFVSLISHKLRTPLTALGCAMHMIEGTPPAEHPELLREMGTRVQDLGGLVDRLFQFTEVLEGSWGRRGTSDLAGTCADIAAALAAGPRPPQLVLDLGGDATTVPLPASRLRLALQNLVDNAVKFSPGDHPWVRIASHRRGNLLEIDVEDRGPGIPASEHASILSAFHQVDAEFTGDVSGAGIGIAIVREVVGRIGGALELRDAKPHGCVFTLVLPCEGGAP
ncbi:MAG: PAS domain-containing sensor histidine kinase [Planctomycetes bacterium]|nr:PAS domain-containing sensor histidine kinase [Planctomycetota bacterium]